MFTFAHTPARGEVPDGAVRHRGGGLKPPADQYAAAATLYNLLTGACVHDLPSQFQRQILRILHADPVPIRDRRKDLPPGQAEVIHRALEREPKDRWPDVGALGEALRPFEVC